MCVPASMLKSQILLILFVLKIETFLDSSVSLRAITNLLWNYQTGILEYCTSIIKQTL